MHEIDEPVELSSYSEDWPRMFDDEARRISPALDCPPAAIEHIGSTAVHGMIAKPIVDIMAGVKSLPPTDEMVRALQALAYESLGEAGVAGRYYFRRRQPASFNLHLVRHGGEHWRANLAIRNLLRSDPDARARYAAAKLAAVRAGAQSLLAYSDAKGLEVARLVQQAMKA